MRMGDRGAPERGLHSDRRPGPRPRPRRWRRPPGRVVEIFGPESSGKTTLALHIIAEAQKAGASPPSSTPSTPSTRPTPRLSGLTSRTSTFPSR